MASKRKAETKEDDDAFYVVEKILDKRVSMSGAIEYLIKWENCSMEESTWEPETNASCPDLIAQYERGLKKKAKEARDKERGDRAETEQPPPAVDSIIGMTEPRAGERMFIVKYADSSVEILPVVEAYDRYPKECLMFYDRHLKIAPPSTSGT